MLSIFIEVLAVIIVITQDIDDIYQYIKKTQKLRTLKEETIELVINGVTSIEELYKICTYSE